MNADEVKSLRKAYLPFKHGLTFADFCSKVNGLSIDKWNFVRASLLYQKALKCRRCEPNIAMVLLCSCADALKVAGRTAGSHKSFTQFYLRYCPQSLRNPPLEYYPNAKPPTAPASFNQALDFIYSKFRCLYVHEGKGRLEPLPKGIFASLLLDKYNDEYYSLDKIKLHDWFEKITLQSLYSMM